MDDPSNGYESAAREYVRLRSSVGRSTVLQWARRLPRGARVLDLGCGHGEPISEVLLGQGFVVSGVDASETLVSEFQKRFPGVEVECNSVESSTFFGRRYDAVVSWGLMFLLPAESQRQLIGKVARALHDGGEFLFTAPHVAATWNDSLTHLPSNSLGRAAYLRVLEANGLRPTGSAEDDGENHYYFASKTTATRGES